MITVGPVVLPARCPAPHIGILDRRPAAAVDLLLQQIGGRTGYAVPGHCVATGVAGARYANARCAGGRDGDGDCAAGRIAAAAVCIAGLDAIGVTAGRTDAEAVTGGRTAVDGCIGTTIETLLQGIAGRIRGRGPTDADRPRTTARRTDARRRGRQMRHADRIGCNERTATVRVTGLHLVGIAAVSRIVRGIRHRVGVEHLRPCAAVIALL